jgi:hypothetical protein
MKSLTLHDARLVSTFQKSLLSFIHNYPHDFIERIWCDDNHLKNHFREKFNALCRQHTSDKAMLVLMSELSDDNLQLLLDWVNYNYINAIY